MYVILSCTATTVIQELSPIPDVISSGNGAKCNAITVTVMWSVQHHGTISNTNICFTYSNTRPSRRSRYEDVYFYADIEPQERERERWREREKERERNYKDLWTETPLMLNSFLPLPVFRRALWISTQLTPDSQTITASTFQLIKLSNFNMF